MTRLSFAYYDDGNGPHSTLELEDDFWVHVFSGLIMAGIMSRNESVVSIDDELGGQQCDTAVALAVSLTTALERQREENVERERCAKCGRSQSCLSNFCYNCGHKLPGV